MITSNPPSTFCPISSGLSMISKKIKGVIITNRNNPKESKKFYLNQKASLLTVTRENYTIDSYIRMIIRRRLDFIFQTIISYVWNILLQR